MTARRADITYNNQWEASSGIVWKDQYGFLDEASVILGVNQVLLEAVAIGIRALFYSNHKEWREMIMWMKSTMGGYPS